MREFFKKLSLLTCLSVTTLLFFSSYSQLFANEPANLVNDLSPTADCTEKEQVIPTCIFSRPTPTTPLELINGDLTVCNCLEKNNSLFAQFETSPSTQVKSQTERERLIEIERKKAANQGLVQSTHYARDKKDLETSLLVYGGQETRQKTKIKDETGKKKDELSVRPPEISTNLTTINQISDKNKDWQCVTYQEYSVQREIPADNTFFQILKKAEFSPADWNVNELRNKFDTAPELEKENIRIKLTFLSRNPIFQAVMKAEPSAKNTAAKILEKQNQLFSILRTLSPAESSTCFTIPNGCFQEIHNNGAFSDYTSKVGSFLTDKEVIVMASEQAANDYLAELEKISSQGDLVLNSVPTDPQGYFNYLQTANRELATSCAGENAQASCYTKFSQHCTHLKAVDARVKQGIKLTSQDVMSGLREETSLHLNLDPEVNPSFRSFNDKICLQPYRNAAGESLNFFQYQTQKCSGTNASLPECSDRKALLRNFLSEFNSGVDQGDMNLRLGFSKMLGDAKYLDVSLAQVAAANNVSESPTELLARFGGEFPSISPEGVLRPAVSSLASRAPVVNSSSSSVSSNIDDVTESSSVGATSSSGSNNVAAAGSTGQSSGRNNAIREKSSFGSTSNLKPDAILLPDLPSINSGRTNYISPVVNTRLPASADVDELDLSSEESVGTNVTVPQVRPSPTKSSQVGGGAVVTGSGQGGGSAASAEVSGGGAGPVPDATRTSGGSTKKKSSGKNLLFKYGLDGNNQPEISLVSPTTAEVVKVGVDRNLMERIKSNPNALEIGQEDLDKILATPDAEVKLVLEATNGNESLTVYAKKDDTGGISFSLKPSRLPASTKKPVRISVLPAVYDNIASDPDVYLNQNSTLINEIVSKPGSPPILQIVSPGKKALIYEVIKTDEYIYHFKLKNK